MKSVLAGLGLIATTVLSVVPPTAPSPSKTLEARLNIPHAETHSRRYAAEKAELLLHWAGASRAYQQVFSHSNNRQLFFSENTGELLHETRRIRSRWRINRTADSVAAATGHRIIYMAGHRQDFERGMQLAGPFMSTLQDIYEWNHVPRELVSHIISESAMNPRAHSSAGAQGICQILWTNNLSIRRFADSLGFAYHPHDMFTEAGFCSAILNVLEKKHGSHLVAASEFHTGPGNMAKIMVNGRELAPDATSAIDIYRLGVEATVRGRLASSISIYTLMYIPNLIGQEQNLEFVLSAVRQRPVRRYQLSRQETVGELSRREHLDSAELVLYNPQPLRARGFVYSSVPLFAQGREQTFWRASNPQLDSAWLDWERWQPVSWDAAEFRALDYFGRRFAEAGNPFMAYALGRYAKIVLPERSLFAYVNSNRRQARLRRFISSASSY